MKSLLPGLFITICLLGSAEAQNLPEGEGKDIVANTCSQCHELRFVTDTRRTRGQWQYIVSMMIEMGAPLPEDQVDIVVGYLAKNFSRPSGPTGP